MRKRSIQVKEETEKGTHFSSCCYMPSSSHASMCRKLRIRVKKPRRRSTGQDGCSWLL